MAEYPGNPALPAEVKQKILTTFRHTATLYQQGKKDDTVVGCEFILKMDPRFAPAQQLLQGAKSGAAVDVAALVRSLEGGSAAGGGNDPASLVERARAALEARDFSGAAALAQQALAAAPTNADASEIGSQAQELQEAQPFVSQFVQKAREALASGNSAEASRQADKAWSIDPGHPELKAVRAAIAESMAPGAGFEFQGDTEAPIGLAGGEVEFEPAAPEAFGFQFAPEDGDISDVPTIGLASPPPAAEPEPPAAGAFGGADAFGVPSEFSFEPVAPAAPAPPPRPAPPAAAEAPMAFSFESAAPPPPSRPVAPAPPPPAAAPAAFDFASATSSDSPFVVDAGQNEKVTQLLAEGDRAFEGGDLQGAIDVWSRIFLIDVTSQAASERIDKAKKARTERDSKVAAIVQEGTRLHQAGSADEARAKLAEAMALDPSHAGVRQLRDQIETGGGAALGGAESRILGPSTAHAAGEGKDILSEDLLGDFVPPVSESESEDEGLYQEPSEEGMFPEAAPELPSRPVRKKGLPMPIVAALAGLLVVAGGAVWFLFLRPQGGGGGLPKETGDVIISQAQTLEKLGKIQEAIDVASRVPQGDPAYQQSVAYIKKLQQKKAAQQVPTPNVPNVGGRPVAEVAAEKKAKGKDALAAGRFLEALPLLDEANRLVPGDTETEGLLKQATEKVTQLQTIMKQFNEDNFEAAIRLLWPLYQADKTNRDVERLLVNSYYNYGVGELQGGTAEKAAEQFKEILQVRPDDVMAQRNLRLADKYRNKPKDLLYRTYIRHLQKRSPSQ